MTCERRRKARKGSLGHLSLSISFPMKHNGHPPWFIPLWKVFSGLNRLVCRRSCQHLLFFFFSGLGHDFVPQEMDVEVKKIWSHGETLLQEINMQKRKEKKNIK